MELPSKILEQIAFNRRSKFEDYMLINMNRTMCEEHLSQALPTNNIQFEIAVTFPIAYNGFFNITSSNNIFYFQESITDEDGFFILSISPGSYKIESLNKENKRIFIDEGHYTAVNYPFTIKPNFSTLGYVIEKSTPRLVITFAPDDSIGDLLGFNKTKIYEKYNLSHNPVDILSFNKISLETDIARGMIFRGKKSGIIHIFNMDVNPGYKYIEKFRGGVQ